MILHSRASLFRASVYLKIIVSTSYRQMLIVIGYNDLARVLRLRGDEKSRVRPIFGLDSVLCSPPYLVLLDGIVADLLRRFRSGLPDNMSPIRRLDKRAAG